MQQKYWDCVSQQKDTISVWIRIFQVEWKDSWNIKFGFWIISDSSAFMEKRVRLL